MKLIRLSWLLGLAVFARAEVPKFELRDGDRVLLLGDALLERENSLGCLEARMHAVWPQTKFTVRNLSWAGDTPKGWSRASFDMPEKGYERLKEQIAMVKPTVVLLGYGMAASLQELTDTSNDITLNRDPLRYGEEPMSAARFKKELGELMTDISALSAPSAVKSTAENAEVRREDKNVRFVLLSPIRHEDLRANRPGTVDPAKHNELLAQYSKSIEELTKERGGRFVNLFSVGGQVMGKGLRRPWMSAAQDAKHPYIVYYTDNGIHLKEDSTLSRWVLSELAAVPMLDEKLPQRPGSIVTDAILRKNDLFFHRIRPANSTYLFGFRKHEQGRNAVEIPQFDPLVEAADGEIDSLKRSLSRPDGDFINIDGCSGFPVPSSPYGTGNTGLTPKSAPSSPGNTGFPEKAAPSSPASTGFFEKGAPSSPASTGFFEKAAPSSPASTGFFEKAAPFSPASTGFFEKGAPFSPAGTGFFEKGAPFSQKNTGNGQDSLPIPDFTLEDGYEITLWADTNLVGKPVGMNWDPSGRLWVACSPVYPQIAPGAHPDDKVVVIEDTDHDGKADKSTTFATDLLIAAGVAPDFGGVGSKQWAVGSEQSDNGGGTKLPTDNRPLLTPNAAYVASSTELLHLTDTDGDGRADVRRVVLSGFGTEDTHQTLHTLKWGPDGRLYFNQSIYIHSHLETPYGMVRVNSGAIMAFDPRTDRTEVTARGWCNPWGHVWDQWGQEFVTDGAGYQGISWLVPGAMYFTYERAPRIMPGISPGSYPKFCGLELIQSPLFPEDWQGHAIVNDFRAHRVARFSFKDLSIDTVDAMDKVDGKTPSIPSTKSIQSTSSKKSGYETKAEADLVRTTDPSFRPIDLRMGPDGALYIADWTNPVINHGEVDFRDPRRDHVNGRIWRIAPKGKAPLKWESLVGAGSDLLSKLTSANAWEQQQARQLRLHSGRMLEQTTDERVTLEKAWWPNGRGQQEFDKLMTSKVPQLRAIAARHIKDTTEELESLKKFFAEFDESARKAREARNALAAKIAESLKSVDADIAAAKAKRKPVAALEKQRERLQSELKEPAVMPNLCGNGNFALEEEEQKIRGRLKTAIIDENPRVRLEAMRALSRIRTIESAELVLEAAVNAPAGDEHYAYAAWLSVNDLAPQALAWVEGFAPIAPVGGSDIRGPDNAIIRTAMLRFALQSLPAEKTGPLLSRLIAKNGVTVKGPWLELIGQSGGAAECAQVFALLSMTPEPRAAAALVAAARRGVRPEVTLDSDFIRSSPEGIADDVVRLAGLWKQGNVASIAYHIRPTATPARIAAAFEALVAFGGDAAVGALEEFVVRKDSALIRLEALKALAALAPKKAVASTADALASSKEDAALAVFRALFTNKGYADALAAEPALPSPLAKVALRAASEQGRKAETLIAALTPPALAASDTVAPDMAALIRSATANGNPAEGEAIYRRAALACTACHSIGGAGGKVGPDLTTLGASAPVDYIVESLVAPNAKVKEGYHAVVLTLKGGRTASGVMLRETPDAVLLRDAAGNETSVPEADITARDNIGSIMPAALLGTIPAREHDHLVAFLSQLGKPGPFDATKASVARAWWLYPGKEVASIVSGKAAGPGARTLTNVDGRLPKAALAEALQLVPDAGDMFVAVAKFSGSGKTRLNLTGITKAYLDGAPLAIASNPSPEVDLAPGNHSLVVKLEVGALPENLRAECPDARFATE